MRTSSSPPGRLASLLVVAAIVAACGATGGTGSAAPARTAASTGASPIATGIGSGPLTTAPATSTGPPPPAGAFDPAHVSVAFAAVASGLDSPLAIVNAHDGSGRLFVAEQGGRIRIVRGGSLAAKPFLDIADRISTGGERGLLGVAFHPKFPADPRVFVDYTDTDGNTRVSSFTVAPASPDRIDPSTERRLLFVSQPFPNHNGGALAFGPDGDLYVSLGDGGSANDPNGNGQSLKTLLGKILRIDIDRTTGDKAYAIPVDNPYADGADGSQPEIWLWGLRNPWRMSFDRATGDLWIGDVGQDRWEDVDVQRAGVPGGTNFGWNRMEGNHCFAPPSNCADSSITKPVADYGHDVGCTVIGGDVYRGTAQPALAGGYVFADYCTGRVWAIDPSTNDYRVPTVVAETAHAFTAFGEDDAGELYAVDITAGALLRVTATAR